MDSFPAVNCNCVQAEEKSSERECNEVLSLAENNGLCCQRNCHQSQGKGFAKLPLYFVQWVLPSGYYCITCTFHDFIAV